MAQWHPDIELDEPTIIDVVDAQLPGLRIRELGVHHAASGWDNAVWRCGDTALRFVQRHVAVPLFEREHVLLERLAQRLPLPIPCPTYIGEVTETVPLPWFAYPLLNGEEVAVQPMSRAARVELGTTIGGFLRTLHDPATLAAVDPRGDLPLDPGRRANMTSVDDRLATGITHAAAAGFTLTAVEQAAMADVRAAAMAADADPTPVLVHGDLHVRHVLVDAPGAVTGVIDWGDACRAPALLDLVVYWALLDGNGRTGPRASACPHAVGHGRRFCWGRGAARRRTRCL